MNVQQGSREEKKSGNEFSMTLGHVKQIAAQLPFKIRQEAKKVPNTHP